MEIKPSYPIRYTPSSLQLAHPERHRENRREAELKFKNSQKLADRNANSATSFQDLLAATAPKENEGAANTQIQQGGFSIKV
jgi:hypothetical protein